MLNLMFKKKTMFFQGSNENILKSIKSVSGRHHQYKHLMADFSQRIAVVAVQSLSRVQLFETLWTTARQTSPVLHVSWSLLRLMSIESAMLSNYLTLCRPLLLSLQSFPASGSFPMSWLFPSGGQSIGASAFASLLPMNIQG